MSDDFAKHVASIARSTTKYRLTQTALQAEFENACVFGYNGGLFRANDMSIISFLRPEIEKLHDDESLVMIDMSNRPIAVKNDFAEIYLKTYLAASNAYHKKMNDLYLANEESKLLNKSVNYKGIL